MALPRACIQLLQLIVVVVVVVVVCTSIVALPTKTFWSVGFFSRQILSYPVTFEFILKFIENLVVKMIFFPAGFFEQASRVRNSYPCVHTIRLHVWALDVLWQEVFMKSYTRFRLLPLITNVSTYPYCLKRKDRAKKYMKEMMLGSKKAFGEVTLKLGW